MDFKETSIKALKNSLSSSGHAILFSFRNLVYALPNEKAIALMKMLNVCAK